VRRFLYTVVEFTPAGDVSATFELAVDNILQQQP